MEFPLEYWTNRDEWYKAPEARQWCLESIKFNLQCWDTDTRDQHDTLCRIADALGMDGIDNLLHGIEGIRDELLALVTAELQKMEATHAS